MGRTLYIGIIGWSDYTMEIIDFVTSDLPGVELLAYSSTNEIANTQVSQKYGVKHVFSSPELLYELHQLDIICVHSPAEYHLAQVEKCLQAGTDVLVDMPLAVNATDCKKLENVVRRYPSQKTIVNLPRRNNPFLIQLQKELSKQAIGNLISIEVQSRERLKSGDIRDRYSSSKGIFMDVLIHDIDMIHWLTGVQFVSVMARGNAKKYPSLERNDDVDTAYVVCTLENGIIANITASRTGMQPDGYSLNIVGTQGTIHYDSTQKMGAVKKVREIESIYHDSQLTDIKRTLTRSIKALRSNDRIDGGLVYGTMATTVAVAMTKSLLLDQIVKL